MSRKTILAITPGHPGQLESLEKHFRIIRLWKEREPEKTVSENAPVIEAVTTYLGAVRKPLLDILPALKIIAIGAVGTDHVDVEEARARGITVTSTPDVLTDDTANIGLGLILTLSRRIVEGDAFIRAGLWKHQAFPLGHSIAGKSLGIVGLGRIGRSIAQKAEAFGMNIHYTGPNKKDVPYTYADSVEALAEGCDYLICACPGGEETHHIITYKVLEALGPKGFFINVARGSVVKEDDLLIALQNRTIAGAALDVYANEPHVPEAFFVMDNVVLTPHIGSATQETRKKMGEIVASNVIKCLQDEV